MQNKKKVLPETYNFLRPKQTKNLARFGVNRDGGYVIEKDIMNKINHLVSFGMADEFSFEIDFLKYNKKNTVQIYDHTVNHKNYILNILRVLRRFLTFRRNLKQLYFVISRYIVFLKFINSKKVNFFPLKISKTCGSTKEIDLDKVFSQINKPIKDIGLKIDIEGDEYNIIEEILKHSQSINILIIEFHNTDQKKSIFLDSMNKLLKIFDVVHLHGNNHDNVHLDGFPNVVEITLVNKKNNLNYVNYPTSFPIKDLDFPNNPLAPDIKINFL